MEYKRLNENVTILNMHNHRFRSIEQLTDGKKTENQVIDEIVHDTIEILDKIEHGTLIELPCKVGDTVYYIEYFCRSKGCSSAEQMYCCSCHEMLERERKKETYVVLEKKFQLKDLSKVNKTIYLTKERAEAQLKYLREVNR